MVEISEITSDDGSNGGDPNKKPQEVENQKQEQVENLPLDTPKENQTRNAIQHQQVENLAIPQQVVKNLRIPEDLPDVINQLILTLLERCEYPSLLCTSKAFGNMVTSSVLFETRSKLDRTECVLYTFIGFPYVSLSRWYILHRGNKYLRLSMISSLPLILAGSAVVTIGYNMYIIGGKPRSSPPISNVFVIDCRFHTWSPLLDMRRARHLAAAGVIDGKIYVVGGCMKQEEDWVEVFDVNKNIWKNVPGSNPNVASMDGDFDAYVVMNGKIYIWDGIYCFSYEPRRRHWESWRVLSQLHGALHGSSCVVDDELYAIPSSCSLEYPIFVYDPRNVVWRPVKGVSFVDLQNLVYQSSKMANLGGKLVILGQSRSGSDNNRGRGVWCVVIKLERRENGEIWGNVESNSRVLTCLELPRIVLSRTVTV